MSGFLKANIAKNAAYEGCLQPNSCLSRVKNGKKLIIFKNFTLVGKSQNWYVI